MFTLAGFLAPYLVAIAAFPILPRQVPLLWVVAVGACVLIVSSPWLIPADAALIRFIASISAATVAIKFIDVTIDIQKGRVPTWCEYINFLTNPFTHVRRRLALERRPPWQESLVTVVFASAACAVAVALLFVAFRVDWSDVPFLVEHASKVILLMLAIAAALKAAAGLWRLSGGTARDFMDRPFIARTPAEFWRRYNRNIHQFFWQDVFAGKLARRAPTRSILLVFALSALLHELIFFAAIGKVQGYQTAFFLLQGLAAASTARVKVRGWRVVPWTAGTFAFNLISSLFFFASIHQVAPFYSSGFPQWLR